MMTPNQLPHLPVPKFTETIRGVPCITVTEHEHLMREYALQARAQATQAEVTDAQIIAIKKSIRAVDPTQPWGDTLAFARAILALRPVRVPMTREQVFASDELMALNGSLLGLSMCDLMQVIRIIEAHHGITAKAKKGVRDGQHV